MPLAAAQMLRDFQLPAQRRLVYSNSITRRRHGAAAGAAIPLHPVSARTNEGQSTGEPAAKGVIGKNEETVPRDTRVSLRQP